MISERKVSNHTYITVWLKRLCFNGQVVSVEHVTRESFKRQQTASSSFMWQLVPLNRVEAKQTSRLLIHDMYTNLQYL